jgi:isochorismate synthase
MNMNPEIIDPLFDLTLWMNSYSFVAWRKPGEKNQNGFKASIDIITDGSFPVKEAFIFSPFSKPGKYPSIAFYPVKEINASKHVEIHAIVPMDLPDQKAIYCDRVKLLTGMMKGGPLHKCVLSRRIDFEDPEESLAPDLFLELCNRYPNAFISLIHIPGSFTWLGATPERFLTVKDRKGYTTALAATRPFDGALPEISEWNQKEKEEQQMVTDYILKILKEKEIQSIACDGPHSMQAGNVIHLKTDIQFSISPETDILSLIDVLHPTPAVCGLPREDALQIIDSLEPYDREYYAGYLGPVSKDNFELYVNLRCMRWIEGKPSLFVGGGITAASVPEQEWEETNFKANTLLDVIEKICNLAGKKPDAH